MRTLMLLYAGAGALLFVLAIPLRLRKVPPNLFYGFRVSPVFDDERVWYEANAYAAGRLMTAGAVTAAAAVALYLAVPALSVDGYALTCLGVFVVAFGFAFVRSLRFARAVAARRE